MTPQRVQACEEEKLLANLGKWASRTFLERWFSQVFWISVRFVWVCQGSFQKQKIKICNWIIPNKQRKGFQIYSQKRNMNYCKTQGPKSYGVTNFMKFHIYLWGRFQKIMDCLIFPIKSQKLLSLDMIIQKVFHQTILEFFQAKFQINSKMNLKNYIH